MRLIDVDAFVEENKEAFEDAVKEAQEDLLEPITAEVAHNLQMYREGVNAVFKNLEKAPTIDAEEVVYCKDCKYARTNILGSARMCAESGKGVGLYDFCSYGERKDD